MNENKIDFLVDDLIKNLDLEIDRINLTLQRLDSLRAGLIKRDESGMKQLLETIRNDRANTLNIERCRDNITLQISILIGCRKQDVNLTKICSLLDGQKKDTVRQKQKELQELVKKLKIEHSATYMLLRDCSRFNRMLLKGFLGDVTETVTYNSKGNSSMHMQTGLVSVNI